MNRLLAIAALLMLAVPIHGAAQQRLSPSSDSSESRVALVIGNASYKDAPLANPVNDARAIAKALNDLGFQVKLQTNLTQAQMRRAIREFGDELHAKQGVGLFYFAGHGVQISNRNFLIPVGADIQREYEVEDQSVDAGAVLSMMQSAKARVNIVILDACRNNPFIRDFRSAINGLAPMQAPAGTLVAFSTAPGQTAIDGTGQFGLYTEHLVENLTVPGLKIEDVFKNVRVGVQRTSGGRQIPWENTSLTGDFYFRAPAAIAAPAMAVAPATPSATPDAIDRAVQAALGKRELEDTARRSIQQNEIERAVMAALRRREQELAGPQSSRAERENQAAKASIERLNKELAELRAAREAEKAQAERVAAAPQQPAPLARPATQSAPVAAAAQQPLSPPVQLALAAPSTRAQPIVNVGGRVERPDVRVGDQWKYQVTDGFTNLKSTVAVEVATVTENRIYTRSAQSSLATLDLSAVAGVVDVWDRDWNQLRLGDVEYTPFYPSFQFPLEAGKSWSGSVTYSLGVNDPRTHQQTAQVVGWERITVPAGTFDAIKITIRGHYRGPPRRQSSGSGTVDDIVWYAPAVRHFVKKETARTGLDSTLERWELVEYKPN